MKQTKFPALMEFTFQLGAGSDEGGVGSENKQYT